MTRWSALLALAAMLCSPVLACARMLSQGNAAAHKCCHKEAQPEAKCCLLDPSLAEPAEPAARPLSPALVAVTGAVRLTPAVALGGPNAAVPRTARAAKNIFLKNCSLRL